MILIVGLFRTDAPTLHDSIRAELKSFSGVDQHWQGVKAGGLAKFANLNIILGRKPLDRYEYIVVVDDDITLPVDFLVHYMAAVNYYDFALAQPARTHTSSIHHLIVRQRPQLQARRTNFVEIGPVFSIRRDLFDVLLPFNMMSPMGWGYDYVWPRQVHERRLKMGIIDATPVEHSLRPNVGYDITPVATQMNDYLAATPHWSPEQCHQTLEEYP